MHIPLLRWGLSSTSVLAGTDPGYAVHAPPRCALLRAASFAAVSGSARWYRGVRGGVLGAPHSSGGICAGHPRPTG